MNNKEDNIKKYNKLIIYYFSGTGNAKAAANWIKEIAIVKGISSVVYDIGKNPTVDKLTFDKNTLIGFCYPTHGFNAPPIVLNFIYNFPKSNADILLLNTRAGMKFFNLHTPGLGGIALWLPALILFIKGYNPIGFMPLDMPSNWISLHPGLNKNTIKFISNNCKRTISIFSNKILKGKPVLNGLWWLPLDVAVGPISILYYLYGRFGLAKTFYANYNCDNCGLCLKNCPVNAIKEVNNRMYWSFSCESCMKCMNNCPKRAIETAHGYSFILWWLGWSYIPILVLKLLHKYDFISNNLYHEHFDLLFNISSLIVGIIIIFFGYKILHQLLRVRFINKIISYTSLTHYKFWKRYRFKQ